MPLQEAALPQLAAVPLRRLTCLASMKTTRQSRRSVARAWRARLDHPLELVALSCLVLP